MSSLLAIAVEQHFSLFGSKRSLESHVYGDGKEKPPQSHSARLCRERFELLILEENGIRFSGVKYKLQKEECLFVSTLWNGMVLL
ncbi:hypothetical protein NPIL_546121 [Nephila pilipes]|uniref:Uncharacterized protein n=1 Tax=Nephila pilipes TaxID=299642 RepID=A0A8X6N778_NEPPI|nr:hypothetical protein NPIL_546121 [Nephila pilipes]